MFLAAAAIILLLMIVGYAQERWLAVVTLLLTDGLIVVAWVVSAWALGERLLTTTKATTGSGPFRFASGAALGLGLMSLVALGLGLAGALNRLTAVGTVLLGPGLWAPGVIRWVRSRSDVPVEAWVREPLGGQWLLLLVAPLFAMMVIGASILPGVLWKPSDPHPYDAMEYHLQGPREWYEAGRIVELPHNVYTYFPFGVEMHYLMAMHLRGGPWRAMYQCQFLSVAWVLLTGMAVYGAVRGTAPDYRAPPAVASAANVLAIATPWMVMLGAVAYTESALALYAVLTVAWALRAARVGGRERTRAIAIAGAMAGFACGVKYTAFPMVVGATLAGVGLLAILSREVKAWATAAAMFTALAIVIWSPWLVRNAVWTRNPVFPLAMAQLGHGHYDAVQVERFRIAHSPPERLRPIFARVSHSWREVWSSRQYGWLFWPTILAALALSIRHREAWLIAGFLLAVLLIWLFFTHLLGRFLVLSLPVAALAIGVVRARGWVIVSSTAAAVLTVVSMIVVFGELGRYYEQTQVGLFGLDDPRWLMGEELRSDLERPGQTVHLVGDAQAFLYMTPTSRLKYRTVFDLPGDAKDMYEAWLGVPRERAFGLIVLNPMEVERLSRTYLKVPGLPPDYAGPRDRPVVIAK
jgi:hypothetical protein